MEITWKLNEFKHVEIYVGAFTEQDVKDSNYDVYISHSHNVTEFFESIGVSKYKTGDTGNATVQPDSHVEKELNKLTYTCPKCQRASHWSDWDEATRVELGKDFPSLGFESHPEQEYCCPKCELWSSQREIEESSKPKEDRKKMEKQLQETLDAIMTAYKKSGKLDEQTKHVLRQKLQECASFVEVTLADYQ